MRCRLEIGRLVAHPCGRRARKRCANCQEPRCPDHLEGDTCTRCTGSWKRPEARMRVDWEEMFSFSEEAVEAFDFHSLSSAHTNYDS